MENRPTTGGSVDTTNFVTKEELADATPATLYEIYRTDTLKETLDEHVSFINPRNVARDAGKIYLNPSSLVPKVFKGDIGNEKTVDLDVVMYSVANSLPDGYTLSDVENDINNKVLFLSNKNFSEVVPKEELKSIVREVVGTGSTIDTSHFITEEILESKGFLTTHQDISNLATREELDKRVTKEELEEKHYVTNEQISSTYATKSEIPQPYSDTELVKRITVLENKQDNDTIYDDTVLRTRFESLDYDVRTSVDSIKRSVEDIEYKLRDYDSKISDSATKNEIDNELRNKENEFNFKFVAKDDLRTLVTEIVNQLKSENN